MRLLKKEAHKVISFIGSNEGWEEREAMYHKKWDEYKLGENCECCEPRGKLITDPIMEPKGHFHGAADLPPSYDPQYMPRICPVCIQITNHDKDKCMKCLTPNQ